MAATDFVTESQVDSLTTNIATAVKANTTLANTKTDDTVVDAHVADTTDAHDASAISVADVGTLYAATEVEAALAEVMTLANTKTDDTVANTKTDDTVVDAHIADAAGAHAASAISFLDVAGDYTATDVEAALAEVRVVADAAAGGGVAINDGLTNSVDAWSSQKISDEIATAVSDLIDGAPGALDTLNELAAAINDDATFTATVTTALANRVRVDTAAQGLTGTQQTNAKTNLGIASSVQNFANDFNTGIA